MPPQQSTREDRRSPVSDQLCNVQLVIALAFFGVMSLDGIGWCVSGPKSGDRHADSDEKRSPVIDPLTTSLIQEDCQG